MAFKRNVNVDSAVGRGVRDALKGKKAKNPYSNRLLRESYELGYASVSQSFRGENSHNEDIAALTELDLDP